MTAVADSERSVEEERAERARQRELHLTIDLCLRVGDLLMASGAGAADVMSSMRLLVDHFGLRRAEIDVTFTALSISYQDEPESWPIVMMRMVKQREIDYEDLTRVDHLLRDMLSGKVGLIEGRAEMARISSSGHRRRRWAVTSSWGVMCASVAVFLGGGPLVTCIAFAAAVSIDRLLLAMQRRRVPLFYQQIAGGLVATAFALGARAAELDVDPSLVVASTILMLLAGVGFMGGIQDAITGFYITAGARLTEALLATAGIIAGVSAGLTVGRLMELGIFRITPPSSGLDVLPVLVIGSGLCAAAFAFATYAPWRALLPIGLLAATAVGFAQLSLSYGFGRTWSTGVAAVLVGVVAYAVSGRIRVPPLVVVVPCIVPMLPGLTIYRGLSLLSSNLPGSTSEGLLALVTAAATATALASGVIFGEFVAQPVKREARRLETRLAGPRLVGPLRSKVRRPRRRNRHRVV